MIGKILNIRLKQLYRESKGIGIVRIIFLLALVAFIFFALYVNIEIVPTKYYITATYLTLILFLHLNRKDKRFLSLIFNRPYIIFITEYFLLSVPLLIISILKFEFVLIALILSGVSIISFLTLTIQKTNRNNFIIRMIPDNNFEWKSGVRKYFWSIVPVWIATVLGSFLIGAVPTGIFLITSAIISFYQESEPRNLIELYELPARKFIKNKLIGSLKINTAVSIIPMLLFLIFHTEYWYIVVYEFIMCNFVITFVILLKYARYAPCEDLSANGILTGMALISIALPFLFAAIIVMGVVYYFKSINNLNRYLNAYY